MFISINVALIDVNGDLKIIKPNKKELMISGFRFNNVFSSKEKLFCLDDYGTLHMINHEEINEDIENSGWLSYFKTSKAAGRTFKINKEKIIKIDTGKHHLIALTKAGNVYSFPIDENANRYGQLGIGISDAEGQSELKYKFNKVEVLRKVVDIACGNDHTLMRTEEGEVYGFGLNSFGQLTNYKKNRFTRDTFIVNSPVKLITQNTINTSIKQEPRITNIFAGQDLSYFCLAKNNPNNVEFETYACGNGRFGLLGNNQYTHVEPNLTKIQFLSNKFEYNEEENKLRGVDIKDMYIGTNHVAALLNNSGNSELGKSVVMWGNNAYGQCNTPKRGNIAVPTYPLTLNKTDQQSPNNRMQLCQNVKVKTKTFKGGEKWVKACQSISMGDNSTAVYFKHINK